MSVVPRLRSLAYKQDSVLAVKAIPGARVEVGPAVGEVWHLDGISVLGLDGMTEGPKISPVVGQHLEFGRNVWQRSDR